MLALLVVTAGCSAEASSEAQPHAHGPGGEYVAALTGDGTAAEEGGYQLADVSLPRRAATPGKVRFRILDGSGEPVRDYLTEQTKDLHLYVVRTDLTIFRHLHPTQDPDPDGDGAWSGPLTLPEPGDYRVVAEFATPGPAGGDPAFVMLGAPATVPGAWEPAPVTIEDAADDGSVRVEVATRPRVGSGRGLDLLVSDLDGEPVELGDYLGTTAHVTAFRTDTYAVAHLHPVGDPELAAGGTRVRLHTGFTEPADYVAFVQVRVDGFVHTVPVWLRVTV